MGVIVRLDLSGVVSCFDLTARTGSTATIAESL